MNQMGCMQLYNSKTYLLHGVSFRNNNNNNKHP